MCGDRSNTKATTETVQIGEQCWFAENLRAENYRNGEAIPSQLSADDWASTSTGAQCVFGEGESGCQATGIGFDPCDDALSLSFSGRLYNWYAITTVGLSINWNVPSDNEWEQLTEFIGGSEGNAHAMKAQEGWPYQGNGNDAFGFAGVPSGARHNDGAFYWGDTKQAAESESIPVDTRDLRMEKSLELVWRNVIRNDVYGSFGGNPLHQRR